MNTKNKNKVKLILYSVIFTILISLINSALTIDTVTITPNGDQNPITTDTLNCSYAWTDGGPNVFANITWYNNSQLYNQSYNVTGPSYMDSSITSKDEIWNCTIILGNETDSTNYMSTLVTVVNSPPDTPFLQYNGIDIGDYYEMTENTTYVFLLNTSDPDLDSLSYSKTSVLSSIGED